MKACHNYRDPCEHAAELAYRYNWPEESKQLKQGTVPEGFYLAVAREIILFKARGPLYNYNDLMGEASDEFAAQELTKLRTLLAAIKPKPLPDKGGCK